MENYKNIYLDDLYDEIWVDCYGYDGYYEVSNLGRIKSLPRYVKTKNGGERLTNEIILKQSEMKDGRLRVSMSNEFGKKTINISKSIYVSFNPAITIKTNECIIHKNKNLRDNRLINLIKDTRKKSKHIDMDKSKKTIIATPLNLIKAQKVNDKKNDIINNRIEKTCPKCLKIGNLILFPKDRNICKKCTNKYRVQKRNEKTQK